MAKGRRKRRTHVQAADNAPVDKKTVPKSFVVRSGSEISAVGQQLVRDLRRVMEPNTASRLRERRSNKLRDYLTMAGPLGVSHIALLSETEDSMSLRLGKFPRGPTLYFRVLAYCLAGDVRAAQRKPRPPGTEFATAPLLVLNNFDADTRPEHKLLVTVLQNYYPIVNASRVKLGEVRRVALYNYDPATDTVVFRHFLIHVKEKGVNRVALKLRRGELPTGISECADIGDYVARACGAATDSEPEDDSMVTLAHDYHGSNNKKSSQRAITLVEIGPRLTLKLIKVTDGLNEGKVLYHAPMAESTGEEAVEC